MEVLVSSRAQSTIHDVRCARCYIFGSKDELKAKETKQRCPSVVVVS